MERNLRIYIYIYNVYIYNWIILLHVWNEHIINYILHKNVCKKEVKVSKNKGYGVVKEMVEKKAKTKKKLQEVPSTKMKKATTLKKKKYFSFCEWRKLSFKTPEPVKTDLHYFIWFQVFTLGVQIKSTNSPWNIKISFKMYSHEKKMYSHGMPIS